MATAREYLRQGYRVLGQYRSKPGELDGTVPVRGDFSTPAGVQEFLNNLNQTETSVDVLVNNAGAFHVAGSWMEITGSGVLDLMQVNLAAPMADCQYFQHQCGTWGQSCIRRLHCIQGCAGSVDVFLGQDVGEGWGIDECFESGFDGHGFSPTQSGQVDGDPGGTGAAGPDGDGRGDC